jgi:hypothetical protein
MKVRDLTTDEQAACRAKAAQKVEQLLGPLKDLPEDELYDGLHRAFLSVAHIQNRCSEHFKGNDFAPDNDTHINRDEEEILDLVRTNLKAVHVMQGIVREMSKLDLAKVNGTSLIFRACADKAGLDPDELTGQPKELTRSNIVLSEREPASYN